MVPASSSYTQRRAHAQALDRSQPEAGASLRAGAAQRWRCSFSSGGRLVFGSRSITVASLGPLDAACRDGAAPGAYAQRDQAALDVALNSEHLIATEALRRYKETACVGRANGELQQSSLMEQHAWKLLAALCLSQQTGQQNGAASSGSAAACQFALGSRRSDATESLGAEREREAMRAWLRGIMWDGTALDCAGASDAADEAAVDGSVHPELARLRQLWALVAGVRAEEAAEQCLAGEGSRAYLAALLAQPAKNVCDDLKRQLGNWRSSKGGDSDSGDGSEAALVPRILARVYGLLSGSLKAQAAGEDEQHAASAGAAGEGQWISRYARSVAGGGGLVRPLALVGDTPPSDPLWHLLRLYAAGGTQADAVQPQEVLRPLPTPPHAGASLASWVRFGDYGFAWHLQRAVSPLLEMGFSCQPGVHDAFAAQLEGAGAFSLLVNAHVCAKDEAALVELLERMPLPDGPSGAMLRLLDAAAVGGYALPAPLPPSALGVLQTSASGDTVAALRLSARIHSAAADRAGYLRCFELSLGHHLTALRLGLAAVEATASDARETGGSVASASATSSMLKVAERSYKAAAALLVERMAPYERLMSTKGSASLEARRSQVREIRTACPSTPRHPLQFPLFDPVRTDGVRPRVSCTVPRPRGASCSARGLRWRCQRGDLRSLSRSEPGSRAL